jgi:glycosyltransferase involved in cell wall biosynthesis
MSSVLSVAHLSPTYFSPESSNGSERYVLNLIGATAQAAQTRGLALDSRVIAVGAARESKTVRGHAVEILRDLSSGSNPMGGIPEGLKAELAGVDLVHIHDALTGFGEFVAAVARSLNLPFVLTDRGGGHSRVMLEGGGVQLATGLLSVSNYADRILGALGAVRRVVVSGPVDTEYFRPDPQAKRDSTHILAVSRIVPHKGIHRIIEAMPPRMHLTVVGRDGDDAYLGSLMKVSKGKKVRFVHDAEDSVLRTLYQSAGVFVQASIANDVNGRPIEKPELTGSSTLEAMASGLVVITSNAGSLPEINSDPRFGHVFATSGELKAKLEDVRDGIWPEPSSAAQSRKYVESNFGFSAVGAQVLDFYAELLGIGSRATGLERS